jgi:Lrp/AsnC family transcriptional regulator, leucine-responsive regulatory protein
MIDSVLNIDEIDKNIIELIQQQPTLTHTEIAKKVNRSQPTIGMRIRKLENNGVLKFQAGINIRNLDLIFARVDLQTLDAEDILDLVRKCPYMLNAFRLSGTSNISIFMVSDKLGELDTIVNNHFRKNPNVIAVHIDIVSEMLKDFVLPFEFDFQKCTMQKSGECCGKCMCS